MSEKKPDPVSGIEIGDEERELLFARSPGIEPDELAGDAVDDAVDDGVEGQFTGDDTPVSSASGPGVASVRTDRRCRITSWGEGAERLFEFRSAQVLGHPLHQILDARDLFGNRVCRWACNIQEMVRLGEEVRPFVLHVRAAGGRFLRIAVAVKVEGTEGAAGLLYELKPDGRRRTRDRRAVDQQTAESLLVKPASSAGLPVPLTASELRVLKLLAAGHATHAIASSLSISAATVRNHTQHILRKLRAHSKLEAVSIAVRDGHC